MSGSLSAQSAAQSLRYFNTTFYLNSNPDVLAAVAAGRTTAFQHFTNFGAKENRSPTSLFNANSYLANNPDIALAVGSGVIQSAWDHFVNVGIVEGRSNGAFTGTFNSAAYLAANPDVQAAIGSSFRSAYEHFLLFGQAEGRVATNTAGQTITTQPSQTELARLTENADSKVGTNGNDLFDGSLVTTPAGRLMTLNNGDSLDGGAGTDRLLVATNNVGVLTVQPTLIRNIEVIDIDGSLQTGAFVLDLANGDAAVTTVRVSNNTGAVTIVQNVQAAPTTIDLQNTNQNFTLGVASTKLSGTADQVTVNLQSVTGAAVVTLQPSAAGSGYETVTVNSLGTVTNSIQLTDGANGNSLTKVNVTGSKDLTLAVLDTTVTTVDAAKFTGKLDVTVAAGNTQAMTITGGTVNDIINMNGTYTALDVINGGDGTDRLVLSNAEAIAALAVQSNVSNIEVIGLSDGLNGTVAVNNFGATGLRFGAAMAGVGTVGYAAGTNSLDLQTFASGGNALTVNVAGVATTDVLNVTAGSATAGNTFGAGSVTINGAETVNITSQGAANTFGAAFTLTDTAAIEVVKITGSQSITFTGAVRADTIDASGLTGSASLNLNGGTATTATTITGTANADVLNGSTKGDIINGGAGNDAIANVLTGTNATASDVLTGGAGFDTFTLRGDIASAAVPAAYSSASQIIDFVVGATTTTTDILQLSATIGNYSGGSAFFAGVVAAAAGATAVQTVAQNAAAAAVVTGADLIKLTSAVTTAGLTVQQAFNTAIGTGTVTGLTGGDDIFVSFYDTSNSKMVVGLVDATSGVNTIVEAGDAVTLIGSLNMSLADYTGFNANNLAIIAA